MQIWFLGTGAGRPSKYRNVSGIAVHMPEPQCGWWLFDAGEATQHQLMQTPLKLSKLEAVFVTHLHGDHIYGLPGLLSSRSFDGGVTPVHLFGPAGIKEYLDKVFEISGTKLDYELIIHETAAGSGVLFDNGFVSVEAEELEHRVPCRGYRLVERDQPGKLDVDKLRAFGVQAGPVYGKLKGGESVIMPDGSVISSAEVTGPPLKGRIITVLGDTKPCTNAIKLANNADLLIHEATFAAGLEEKAHEFGHSTTIEAAQAAQEAGAKKLVMTHFSGRYSLDDLLALEAEARLHFEHSIAASDLMMIDIKRRSS